MTSDIDLWNSEAPAFDEAPDHGLLDPDVRDAWRDLLLGVLPSAPADVVDLGCGTGTLAVLLAAHGYAVDALDFSPAMVRLARAKVDAAPARVRVVVMVWPHRRLRHLASRCRRAAAPRSALLRPW